jgi:hypothetical protein
MVTCAPSKTSTCRIDTGQQNGEAAGFARQAAEAELGSLAGGQRCRPRSGRRAKPA